MNAVIVALLALSQPSQPARPDPIGDGPSKHKVHFATSDDGLHLAERPEPIMLQASVPDIIELATPLPASGSGKAGGKGTLLVYAVDARTSTGAPRRESLSRLFSLDGGRTWGGPDPIRIDGLPGNGAPVDPSIVQLPDGRLRLYFYYGRVGSFPPGQPQPRLPEQPQPRTPDQPDRPPPREPPTPPPREPTRPPAPTIPVSPGGPHAIMSATSDDGAVFTADPGTRLEMAEITDPEVVQAGGEWFMFLSRGTEVVLARSKDGLAFKPESAFRLTGGGVPGALALRDGSIRVYQSARQGITSTVYNPRDGSITADAGIRIEGPCADPAIWEREAGGFVMVIKRFMDRPPTPR